MAAEAALARILGRTQARVERLKRERPREALSSDALYRRRPRDFARAFAGVPPRVIAEIKFASPSRGRIYPGEASAGEAERVAQDYLAAGAAALSVLTEPDFFHGAVEFLRRVRRSQPEAPLLMKDFLVDEYQLHLARWSGADAALLIVAVLRERLGGMVETARSLELTPLVEAHTEEEVAAARACGAPLIGINCRDLATLRTDLDVARRLAQSAGSSAGAPPPWLIAESGIRRREELAELAGLGYRGFLIGTTLMQTGAPGAALRGLLA